MDRLYWQVVEHLRELVFSIFDCFLVIDYVEDTEIGKLKTFLLDLVIIRYHLYLVELSKYFLLLTNALIFCIFILSGRSGGDRRHNSLIVSDVSKPNCWFLSESLATEGVMVLRHSIIEGTVQVVWHYF